MFSAFRKGERTRDQIANIHWFMEKARESQKNIYFCFIVYEKAFDCVDHNKLWKILKEMGIPDHLPCHLRKLYAGQEATVRTGHGTTYWFQTGKGVRQCCILSPCLFNFIKIIDFIFLGPKITGNGNCSHEIKTLAPWKKSYDKPRQCIKSRDITMPTKVHIVKAMVLLVVMYGCESWTVKKAEH